VSIVRELVDSNLYYFIGTITETEKALQQVELALNIVLPEDLKWLLVHRGYGKCTITPNIQESVEITTLFRKDVGLPSHFLVLEDLHDAGVVLLNTRSDSGAVTWLETHCIEELQERKESELSDADHFPTFDLWVKFKLHDVIEEDAT